MRRLSEVRADKEGAKSGMGMKLWIALLPGILSAQVDVVVSPVPQIIAKRLLGRASKATMIWTVNMTNTAPRAISITQSAILRRIPQLQPFDHETMALLVEEGARNSIWARLGRGAGDVGKVGAFLAASKQIKWGDGFLAGLTAGLVFIPYLVERLQEGAVPGGANFERLAWAGAMNLGPGESATAHVFTAKVEPRVVEFRIEVESIGLRKMVQ
jgi:hypothetical protein